MNQLWTDDMTGKKYVFNSINGAIYKSDVNGNPIKRYNTSLTGIASFHKRIDFVEKSAVHHIIRKPSLNQIITHFPNFQLYCRRKNWKDMHNVRDPCPH